MIIKKLAESKYNILLLIILLISFGIRVYNLNYNSPFLDEAIYLTLGRQVLTWQWQPEDPYTWVGGNPLFYPAFSALSGMVGGIVGSRFLNVLLGTFSVYLLYRFGKMLNLSKVTKTNEIVGLISAAFMGILAMPVFLSRWAIYDMLSFTLFLLGLVLLQRALSLKKPALWELEGRFLLPAVFFFLSFMAKYITLILFPVIIIWAIYKSKQLGKESLSVALRYFVLPLGLAIVIYFFRHMEDLLHFQREQVSTTSYSVLQILTQYLTYALPAIVIAIMGTVILLLKKKFITTLFLISAAAIVPIVHIATNNFASVHQHAYLSIIFLLPLGAYFFTKLYENQRIFGGALTIITLLMLFTYSQSQVRALETMWTNSNDVMAYLKENTTSHERILTTEGDVSAVALPNIKNENIVGYYYFEYKKQENTDAYTTAINDGYFDFILVDKDNTSDVSKTVKDSVTSHYAPLYYKNSYIVYKKEKQ